MCNPCHRSLIGSSISSPRKRNITHLAEKRQNDRNFGIGRQHGDPIAVFASTWNDQWPWDRGLNFESGRYLNRGCSMEKESPVIYAVYNLSRHSPFRLGEDRTGSEPRPQVFLYKIPRLLEYGADMSGMCNSSSQDSQWYVYSDMCTHSDTVICEDIITDLKCNNWDSFLNLGTEEVFETDVVEVWKCQYVMIECQC